MKNNTLLVPIYLDALYLEEEKHCAEPRLDFSRLPYFNGKNDENPYVAHLGDEIQSIPFREGKFKLEKGVHLHWALPDALTRSFRYPMLNLEALRRATKTEELYNQLLKDFENRGWIKLIYDNHSFASILVDSEQIDIEISKMLSSGFNRELGESVLKVRYLLQPGGTQMPPVPNRWIITRSFANSDISKKTWVVESDYLAPSNTENLDISNAVPYPKQRAKSTDAPFGWLGRKYEYGHKPEAVKGEAFLAEPLTATGYGDPTFAAFYPNCHSVFGFHDDLSDIIHSTINIEDSGLTYELMGYYNSPDYDYLRLVNFDTTNRAKPIELTKALYSVYHNDLQFDFGADLEELLQMDKDVLYKDLQNLLPGNLICGARLNLQVDGDSWKSSTSNNVELSIGNTATEAMAAFLSNKISKSNKLKVEEYLESLQFLSSLDHMETDIGAKFRERRHDAGFASEKGGSLWVLKPPVRDGYANAENAASKQVILPDEWAHFLNELNNLQLEFDRIDAQIKTLRKQIYLDWSRYMLSKYPPDGSDDEYPDADEARFYIETIQLPRLTKLNDKRQQIAEQLRQKVNDYWLIEPNDITDWNKLLRRISQILRNGVDELSDEEFDENLKGSAFIKPKDDLIREIIAILQSPIQNLQSALKNKDNENVNVLKDLRQSKEKMIQFINSLITEPNRLRDILGSHTIANAQVDNNQVQSTLNHLLVNRKLLDSVLGEVINNHPGYELKIKPNENFYRPTDPVILFTGDNLRLTEKHGQDGLLKCLFLKDKVYEFNTINKIEKLSEVINEHSELFPIKTQRVSSNHPLILDWLVEFFPLKDQSNDDGQVKGYSSSYIQGSYNLRINSTDFNPINPQFTEAGHNFWGSTILTSHVNKNVKDALEIFLKQKLDKIDLNPWYDLEQFSGEDRKVEMVFKRLNTFSRFYCTKTPDKWLKIFFVTVKTNPSFGWFMRQNNFDNFLDWDPTDISFAKNEQPPFTLWESKHVIIALLSLKRVQRPNYLSQSLGGLTQALLMHRHGYQLDLADPLGYPEYQEFTRKVADAVGLLNHSTTLPNNPFFPIRSGSMSLVELGLFDTFGLNLATLNDIEQNNTIHFSDSLKPVQERQQIHFKPRLTQSARLNFHWLSAEDDTLEHNNHPAASPVCGWVLANYLDKSLMIYDQKGKALGYLDLEGQWRVFPGHSGPILPEGIQNWHLRRMVRWLAEKAKVDGSQNKGASKVVPHFIQLIEKALQKIEPERGDQAGEGIAMLMSRPLALVRAKAKLELKGLPAIHQGWSEFQSVIDNPEEEQKLTHNLENVKIPLRLGEDHQLNDGLIGFWEDADDGEDYREDCFRVPSLHRTTHGLVDTDHPVLDTLTLGSDGSNARGIHLNLLMDPHGAVHATCGILPVKKLELPTDLYADAIKRLEISFLTAPIISTEGLVNISLPDEPGFHWSWISLENRQWKEVSTIGHFKRHELANAFGENATNLWNDLLQNGWITAKGDEAVIVPKNKRKESEKFPEETLKPKLEFFLAGRQIGNFQTTPNFHGPQEIREGWLKLKPAPQHPNTITESKNHE